MIAYNGGSISNLLKNLDGKNIYVTDTAESAIRYANTQASGVVKASHSQDLAEGAVVLEVECNPEWLRRSKNHSTLDTCEAVVTDFRISKAVIHFSSYQNTLYGPRGMFSSANQVVEILNHRGIEVEIL